MRACLVAILSFSLAGCTGMRFIVDTVPKQDKLSETVVMSDEGGIGDLGKSKVALIDVNGLIADAERPGLLSPGENPVSRFVESLQRAKEDSAVKAVVIRINS